MRRAPRNPASAKRWATFLSNHREALAAMDFFAVPTLSFGVPYCLLVIAHHRRHTLHFNLTRHRKSACAQQLHEAFHYDSAPRYLIFDRATQFNGDVVETMKSLASGPSEPASQVLGRTALRNVGSVTAAGIFSTKRSS